MIFKESKNKHKSNAGNNSSTETEYSKNMYDWENDKALCKALQKIIVFNSIEIEIISQWIRILGNTYSYKNELKDIGFKWEK